MEREEQFRKVFELAYPAVARYVRNHGYRGQDAEDLVASTFEVVWKRLDDVPTGGGTVPWVVAVARNLARNTWRKSVREQDLVGALAVLAPSSSDAEVNIGRASGQELRAALMELKPIDRELILLVAWDELEPSVAGEVLGLSSTAARSRLHRARQRLSVLLTTDQDYRTAQPVTGGPLPMEEQR